MIYYIICYIHKIEYTIYITEILPNITQYYPNITDKNEYIKTNYRYYRYFQTNIMGK